MQGLEVTWVAGWVFPVAVSRQPFHREGTESIAGENPESRVSAGHALCRLFKDRSRMHIPSHTLKEGQHKSLTDQPLTFESLEGALPATDRLKRTNDSGATCL